MSNIHVGYCVIKGEQTEERLPQVYCANLYRPRSALTAGEPKPCKNQLNLTTGMIDRRPLTGRV